MMNTGTQHETPVFTGVHDQSSTVESASEPLIVPSGATRNQSPAFGEDGYRAHQLATLVAQLEATSAKEVKLAVLAGLLHSQEAAEKEDRLRNGYLGQYSALSDLINFMTGYTR